MAFNTYVKIEDTVLPLPDSFDLSYSNVEADSSGETEAGTVQRSAFLLPTPTLRQDTPPSPPPTA